MLPTQSAGAGAFEKFDLRRVPSPCFVVDEIALRRNLEILQMVKQQGDVKILLALKAFSMWSMADLIGEYLDGCCASGLWEAKLARQHYRGALESYAPAYKASEVDEIARLSDHMIFNSPDQVETYGRVARQNGADVGLRINPQHSEGLVEKYDPSATGSRLGWPIERLDGRLPDGVVGLHIHNLCEQGFAPLKRTVEAVLPQLHRVKGQLEWLNLGGGHMITSPDYPRAELIEFLKDLRAELGLNIFLEPGTAVAFDAGILVGEILDVTDNDGPIAIADISATCHMPDVIEAPYRPALLGEVEDGASFRIGGPSCLAGDVIGAYCLPDLPIAGQRIAFLDQAHYSMVKTTTFNGVVLPAIAIWNSQTDDLKIVREFEYRDFERRLS
jgi:carboxynorspermidine decarboxylase